MVPLTVTGPVPCGWSKTTDPVTLLPAGINTATAWVVVYMVSLQPQVHKHLRLYVLFQVDLHVTVPVVVVRASVSGIIAPLRVTVTPPVGRSVDNSLAAIRSRRSRAGASAGVGDISSVEVATGVGDGYLRVDIILVDVIGVVVNGNTVGVCHNDLCLGGCQAQGENQKALHPVALLNSVEEKRQIRGPKRKNQEKNQRSVYYSFQWLLKSDSTRLRAEKQLQVPSSENC